MTTDDPKTIEAYITATAKLGWTKPYASLDRMTAELTRLRAENERLRAAVRTAVKSVLAQAQVYRNSASIGEYAYANERQTGARLACEEILEALGAREVE